MVTICQRLIDRLSTQPISACYMEVISMKCIRFLIQKYSMQVSYERVKTHFQECMQLLSNYGSQEDSLAVLQILQTRLAYFTEFDFPIEERKRAHVEFEQYHQCYIGMEEFDADQMVATVYRDESFP